MIQESPSAARARALQSAVREKYRAVARRPEARFPYPVGRRSALRLRYEPAWIDALPDPVVRRFVGVGNPFAARRPRAGERVLDLGCGAGFDAFVAALLVGERGTVVGLDLTREMLDVARRHADAWPLGNVAFRLGKAERLPFEASSFDLVVSNGVLNLVPDKDAAFQEAFRVLRPGGAFAVADLLVTEEVPEEVLADMDAWST